MWVGACTRRRLRGLLPVWLVGVWLVTSSVTDKPTPVGGVKVKLNRAVFRYIEHELYNYDSTMEEIEFIRENIINAPPLRDAVPGTGYVSDPTAKKATKLITNTVLMRMARTVSAIERALKRLNTDHRAVFELKYRQGLRRQQVCVEIPTSERTYFRLRRELVHMVALEMGLAESWQE